MCYLCWGVMSACDKNVPLGEVSHLDEARLPNEPVDENQMLSGKTDAGRGFPQFQDLAIIIPHDEALIQATKVMPERWIHQVDEALAASELDEYISDENYIDDWRLVSLRVSPCSPLGRVADPEEIDRLCWPGVRLVFQPLIERINIRGTIRDHYADDRAIHALYRFAPQDPELQILLEQLQRGQRLLDLDPQGIARFENARDQAARSLLSQVRSLRLTDATYGLPQERPEFYDLELSNRFREALLTDILNTHCSPSALHELTAFSLPLGRRPASLDLWSFVAFTQDGGELTQASLEVRSREEGKLLYIFEGEGALRSEDVTMTHGDYQLTEALSSLEAESRTQLEEQVIIETALDDPKIEAINDPYQTLVSHTTCASCHRANGQNFNFHNLSYFEDQEISISPRTFADVERDLSWSVALLRDRSHD